MTITMEQLIELARQASGQAYAPYSQFAVGAALLTEDGAVITGCNVENASYGLTMCAERVAVFKAVCGGQKEFKAIAIYAPTEDYCSPCGACRQVLAEFGSATTVIMANNRGEYQLSTVAELLPATFKLK